MADAKELEPVAQKQLSRDLNAAREAYKAGDVEAARAAHGHGHGHGGHSHGKAPEAHSNTPSEYIKSMVFGGLDGIITTFAVVAAVAGADMSGDLVILMGVANLVSDGISMGLGDYFSEKSEKDYIKNEWMRETWELENYPEGEKQEMVELYEGQGMDKEDAATIVNTFAKYPDKFVNLMMVDELGLEPWDEEESQGLWKQGLVTMLSFWFFGAIPVVGYAIIDAAGVDNASTIFAVDCVVTLFTMFALGAAKAKVTNTSIIQQGGLMMLNGAVACGAGYLIAWAIAEIMGNPTHSDCDAGSL